MQRWDDGPLVGRAEELAHLLEHVDRAVAGRPSAVLLAGDAGVGKTRLLDELAERARERGVRVLAGHCVDLGDVGLPYLPFVDLLRPVVADPELAPATAALPALTDLLSGGHAAVTAITAAPADFAPVPAHRNLRPAPDDGRLQLFESVSALLGTLSADAPLLVVLEDLHWADRSSRDLLRYLLARQHDERIAFVASYRSDDLHRRHPLRPLLAELVRLPGVEATELGPLPDSEVARLVRHLAGSGRPVEDAELARVVKRAEGNAFYAEELVAAGLRCDSLPDVLADVLLARLERLGPDGQQVLRVAAVAGRRVRHELMAAVSGLPAPALEQALAEAVHHHLLVVDDDRYRFRHALLREAVLADLLPGERVRLHRAVAAYLTEHPAAGTAAERAHHARESNDLAAAFSASLEAAVEARRAGAPAEQLQQLEVALGLWSAVPDAAERAGCTQSELLFDAALAARTGGDLHRSVALLRSARDAGGGEAPALRARVHYTLAQLLIWLDDFEGDYGESSAAMRLVPADPPSPERAWAAATHARSSVYVGRREESGEAAQEALAAADALGLDSAWADTAVSMARISEDGASDPLATGARMSAALERARRSGDIDVEMRVLFNLAMVAHEAGQLREALTWTESAVERARAMGVEWSFYPAELRHLQIVTAYMAGEWDLSLGVADQLSRLPQTAEHVRAAGLLVLVGRGDPAARERIAWARGLDARPGDQGVMLLVNTAAAEVDLAGWERDAATAVRRAEEDVRRLAELWPVDRLAAIRIVATALGAAADAAASARLVGDEAAAGRWMQAGEGLTGLAEEAVAASTASGARLGVEARAWQARLTAELARLRGEAAPGLWRSAIEAFAEVGHVYEQARSRWRLAEALLAADQREDAATELRAAHEVAVTLGAAPLRTAVEALARRGRLDIDVRAARPAEVATVLTPREAEVLALMAQGRTNRQIGAALYISEKTASVHVSNILGKLAASGRTEAVAIAAEKGLLAQLTTR